MPQQTPIRTLQKTDDVDFKRKTLQLSRKKTRIGSIAGGFHFLGINYLETHASDITNVTQDSHGMAANESFAGNECLLVSQTGGGKSSLASPDQNHSEQICIVPHARTIRNAREQVRLMVIDGFSTPRIRSYLSALLRWWVKTSQSWNHQFLLSQFIHSCYDAPIAGIALEQLRVNNREG